MPRKALLIGIDTYDHLSNLMGCVTDAKMMSEVLGRHKDKDRRPNYECRVLADKMEDGQPLTRSAFRGACRELFEDFKGDILFYFSGHGILTPEGGYLSTRDATEDDWGVSMQDIVQMATESPASDILFILDCCHSGEIANKGMGNPLAALREDMTVIAASRHTQVAVEVGGRGLFTAAVLEALEGGAADHIGWVTAPSIYAYVERRFGAHHRQRPVYKSYTTRVTTVRECEPLIDRWKLHRLTALFPSPDFQYQLDSEYEPEDEHGRVHEPVNREKMALAQLLKDYRDTGLLKASIPGEQFFWTARRGHTVELTVRGREYWWLVSKQKI